MSIKADSKDEKHGMENGRWTIGLICLTAALLIAQPVYAQTNTNVSIGNFAVNPGESVTGLITMNVTNFGTATIELWYNSSVVNVTSVRNGNIPDSSLYSNIDNQNGTTRMLVYTTQIPGPSGNFVYANLTLRAVGQGKSPLNLYIEEFADPDGNPISVNPINGSFTVAVTQTPTPKPASGGSGAASVTSPPPTPTTTAENATNLSIILAVNKDIYFSGEPVVITITNLGSIVVNLPNAAPWYVENTETKTIVYSPISAQVITPLEPGQSFSWTWNQNTDVEEQVPSGVYRIGMRWDGRISYTKEFEILSIPPSPTPTPLTPVPTPSLTPSSIQIPTPKPGIPGFEAVFAITGLLAVACLLLRRKK